MKEALIAAMVVGLVILAFAGAAAEQREWEAFKASHSCKVVAKIKGGTTHGYGTDSKGNSVSTTSYESDKTGWLCDDGVTYYR